MSMWEFLDRPLVIVTVEYLTTVTTNSDEDPVELICFKEYLLYV